LLERTQDRAPFDWAATQNNLGVVLSRLGLRGGGAEPLEAAIAAFNEALKVRTRDRSPLYWAKTQENLAVAFNRLGEREDVEKAVASYVEVLKVWTREGQPFDWARTQNDLGVAYFALASFQEKTEGQPDLLGKAVDAFNEALKERTRERVPLQWAVTEGNLGDALKRLAERDNQMSTLEMAARAYAEALKAFTPDAAPLDHDRIQRKFQRVEKEISERKDK
jgi:tetratricopeptide (TPR) repeat protein